MTPKSAEKRSHILACAERVFVRKGYASVTMKDIIEECGISRGGIYLYFSSVDEIFAQVISLRNRRKLDTTRGEVEGNTPFGRMLDDYFSGQKQRLLHMEDSLKAAMYEYTLSHRGEEERAFYAAQFHSILQRILEILRHGAARGDLPEEHLEARARHLMLLVEGMSSLALSGQMTPEIIDEQFALLRGMLFGANIL